MTGKSRFSYSLLVPCFDAANYAGKCIDHLSHLTRVFDEIIFYDDASTDDTAEIITTAGFNLMRGEINKGPGYARNRLAEKATCDYIHFHDIDDEFNPKFLELVDKKLTGTKADVIAGQADWIDANTLDTIIKWQYKQDDIDQDPLGYVIANPLGIINTVYKREAFLKVNGFNENIKCWEDADLHVRLAASEATFSVIDEVLAYSIRHNSGISQNQEWCWECRQKFLENYKASLDPKYYRVLGREFEKTANNLFHYGKYAKSVRAFRNSRNSGYSSPSVNNPLLKNVKKLSPLTAFLLKELIIKIKS
jgi:glycosyltransferase involved in cell wall biosynthesis